MKLFVLLSLVAVILQLSNAAKSTKVCSVSKTCHLSGPVCGELKRYKTCMIFRDQCEFERKNCNYKFSYDLVDSYRCEGLRVGKFGSCKSSKKTYKLIASLPTLKPNLKQMFNPIYSPPY